MDWERLNDLSCSLEQQLGELLQQLSTCGEEMKATLAKQKSLAARLQRAARAARGVERGADTQGEAHADARRP